jgi:hypothetical protein
MQHGPLIQNPRLQQLATIKRSLIEAQIHTQDATAKARRAHDYDLAERLYDEVERLANEIDYIEILLLRLD